MSPRRSSNSFLPSRTMPRLATKIMAVLPGVPAASTGCRPRHPRGRETGSGASQNPVSAKLRMRFHSRAKGILQLCGRFLKPSDNPRRLVRVSGLSIPGSARSYPGEPGRSHTRPWARRDRKKSRSPSSSARSASSASASSDLISTSAAHTRRERRSTSQASDAAARDHELVIVIGLCIEYWASHFCAGALLLGHTRWRRAAAFRLGAASRASLHLNWPDAVRPPISVLST